RIASELLARGREHDVVALAAALAQEDRRWELLSNEEDEGTAAPGVFAWSYQGIPREVARTFRLIGACPGSDFSVPALAALCGVDAGTARRHLKTLTGYNMAEDLGGGRFHVHDLLRGFALDRSRTEDDPADMDSALHRLLAWCAASTKAASRAMWIDTLD